MKCTCLSYAALSAVFLAASVYAEEPKNFKNELIPLSVFKQNYIAFGGGGTFPMQNSSMTDNSNVWILGLSPTATDTTAFFFNLNDVTWNNTYKDGYEVNLALGHRFNPFWAAELEGVYQNMQREVDGDYTWANSGFPTGSNPHFDPGRQLQTAESVVNLYAVLANAIFSHVNHTPWTPFIGIGLGAGFYNSSGTTRSGVLTVFDPPGTPNTPTLEYSPTITGTTFAWQFKTGISYDVNETVSLILQYRLLGTTQLNASSSQIITNPYARFNQQAFFDIPVNNVKGVLINGVDLNIRFNV